MPPQPHRPRSLAWQVFRGSDAVRSRLLTEHQLRSTAWIRLRHDVYADARLDRDHGLACRAAMMRLPPRAVIGGPSAAYLHGVEHAADFGDDVHVIVPTGSSVTAQCRLRIHRTELTPGEVVRAGDPPRTTPAGTAWDVAARMEPVSAVAVVDSLLGLRLTTRNELAEVLCRRAGRPGWLRAKRVFDLADPGAQSAPESHLRVRLVLAGLPPPVTQYPIRLAGGVVLHPDLSWPEFKVAVEYDGVWHADAEQLHRDRQRLNRLVAAGWIVLHVTSRRLHRDFPAVLREVREALLRRGWRS